MLELVLAHRTTIIFCNARRSSERLAAKLNELYEEQLAQAGAEPPTIELARAHHGSLAREQRVVIEDQLKRGELRAIVATSSLELGIDMGAVDLVVQIESPGAVSRGLQRIGRAGHQVGEPSRGSIFPKHRGDLVEAAVVTRLMIDGEIEHTRYLRNPLDVLAQQIVAHVAATESVTVADLAALVRRCANFHEISDDLLGNVLDLLAGRYPSDEFSELRPRIVWDRLTDTIRARDGSKRLAVTSGGTIPDRGLFGVFLPDGTRVGELDEEMVYESRPGEAFVLGASTWRIEDISFERVTVTPAPGVPAKMPFWHGDRPGRPLELGRRGRRVRPRDPRVPPGTALDRLQQHYALDALAAGNVVQYLAEQAAATGAVPDDRTIVVERFRDEIGDWRVCILSPFGTPVHAPWAMAIERRFLDRHDLPVETMWGDDGIVIRLPEAADALDIETFLIDPDEIDEIVVSVLPQTSLFSARFRECAGRALLLPRRRPDRRTPLWQQRQRAADLLTVASKYPTFPILLETSRECLQDVFDVPALREVLGHLQSRRIRLVHVDTASASPMASSLLFNWIAAYMYEGDAPLAERRAAALALDRDLLRDLLGAEELRELLDPGVLADVELELQYLADGRQARTADELHDVLRRVGDLTAAEADLRVAEPGAAAGLIATLVGERRAIEIGVAGEVRYAAADDAALYRDALGCAIPVGLPVVFTDPVARPSRCWWPATAARTVRSSPPRSPVASARRSSGSRGRSRRSPPTSGSCAASSDPTACSANGATPTCSASCAGARSPRSAARSSRSRPPRSHGSCPPGMASAARVAVPTRSSMPCPRWPAHRSWPRRSSATCCRRGWLPTGRARSTSCAPVATSCGSAQGRSAHATAVCGCASPIRSPSSHRVGSSTTRRAARCTRRYAACSPSAARCSGASCARPTHSRPTRNCSPPSGTSCGRARSPTTRWPRCGRCSLAAAPPRPSGRRGPRRAPGRAASTGSAHRPARAGGAWSRPSSSPRPPAPRRRTPRPSSCSIGSAW